jgi:hypothetical protein
LLTAKLVTVHISVKSVTAELAIGVGAPRAPGGKLRTLGHDCVGRSALVIRDSGRSDYASNSKHHGARLAPHPRIETTRTTRPSTRHVQSFLDAWDRQKWLALARTLSVVSRRRWCWRSAGARGGIAPSSGVQSSSMSRLPLLRLANTRTTDILGARLATACRLASLTLR